MQLGDAPLQGHVAQVDHGRLDERSHFKPAFARKGYALHRSIEGYDAGHSERAVSV